MTRDSLRSERDVVEFQASAPRVVLQKNQCWFLGDSRSARKPPTILSHLLLAIGIVKIRF